MTYNPRDIDKVLVSLLCNHDNLVHDLKLLGSRFRLEHGRPVDKHLGLNRILVLQIQTSYFQVRVQLVVIGVLPVRRDSTWMVCQQTFGATDGYKQIRML